MNRPICLLVALMLAAVAQYRLTIDGMPRDSLWLFLLAGIIFAAFSRSPPPWPALPPGRSWSLTGLILALSGVGLVAITMVQFWSGQYHGWAFWLWLVAIGMYTMGVWLDGPNPVPGAQVQPENGSERSPLDRRLVVVFIAVILLVAVGVRFYALDTFPNGCQSDECNNGLDALKWLSGKPYVPYSETNVGQATLFTYIIAALISIFGPSVETMRIAPALVGSLTVLAFYFLAREVFDRRVALLATALLAVDRWHITFSRIVYELILVPLVLSLQVLFLLKALKTGRRRWWALSGMMLALGMNTYTGYRVVPFLIAGYLLYWLVTHRQRIRRDFEGILVFAGGALVAVAPLGIYTIRNWNVFIIRINNVSVSREIEAAGSFAPLWSNLRKTLSMFNWRGDFSALNNLPDAPLLQAAVAVLLVLGIAWAIRWFWKELPFLYLVWFVAVISVAVLSVAHEAPTARRPIGLLPIIYLLVATVFDQLWRSWEATWGEKRGRPVVVAIVAVVLVVMVSNVNTYFRVQAVDDRVWGAYSPIESAIGEYLTELPEDERVYMSPGYVHHSAVNFIGGFREVIPLNLAQHVPLLEDPGGDATFILEYSEARVAHILQQLYPDGEYAVHRDRFGRTLFLSYRIPRAALDAAWGLRVSYIPGRDPEGTPVRVEQRPMLDVDFATSQAPAPPFVARFDSALLAPQYGLYTFELTATGGEGRLFLDDVEVLVVEDGVEEIERTLAGGFQNLRVDSITGEATGLAILRWKTPGVSEMTTIPPGAFYNLPGAANGLNGFYYNTPDWSGVPALVQRDQFIIPNNVLRESYSIRWVGKIAAPASGSYVFGSRSDDGSFVYIDDQLVVDNGGPHGAEYREGVIELEGGFHDIEVLYYQVGGSRAMDLWWEPPGAARDLVSPAYLYPVNDDLPQGLELLPSPDLSLTRPEAPRPGDDIIPETEGESQGVAPGKIATDSQAIQLAVLWTYGTCGVENGDLLHPSGVAIDAKRNSYVADTGNHRIVKLSPEGEFLDSWGGTGTKPGRFTEVYDVAITPNGEIAALDAVNQVISLWTREGEYLREFGANLAMYRPRGLGISPRGDYYVADTGGARVIQINAEGTLVNQFGGRDADLGPGQPTDAAIGADGLLFVTEPIAGALWRVDPVTGEKQRSSGPEADTIESPHLATMTNGRVILTDPESGRILIYSPAAKLLGRFGGDGAKTRKLFSRPVGIAVGEDGTIVVSDRELCRVTAFSELP